MAARRSFPTPSASSPICRRRSFPPFAPRSKRCSPRTSSSICATFPTRTTMRRAKTSMRSWPRLASPTAPTASSRSGTSSTASMRTRAPRSPPMKRRTSRRRWRSQRRPARAIDRLLKAIEDRLARGRSLVELTLDASDGLGLHWLYEHAEVMSRRDEEAGLHLTVRVAADQIERVKRRFPVGGAVARASVNRSADG